MTVTLGRIRKLHQKSAVAAKELGPGSRHYDTAPFGQQLGEISMLEEVRQCNAHLDGDLKRREEAKRTIAVLEREKAGRKDKELEWEIKDEAASLRNIDKCIKRTAEGIGFLLKELNAGRTI
ncbi:MAG: hypothetical protein LBL21_02760 [Rickettsiales bacterium]|jgi:hypothetical protein|nr:hypothetical protein [Rickettsiales bacterium]